MRFLRAEEIKELLAWTAQELQTVQDTQRREIPKRRCMAASMAHSRFPAWLSKLTDRLTACFQTA